MTCLPIKKIMAYYDLSRNCLFGKKKLRQQRLPKSETVLLQKVELEKVEINHFKKKVSKLFKKRRIKYAKNFKKKTKITL